MTANQIAFYQAQEQARHNLAMEALERGRNTETERHNKSTEDVSVGTLQETARSNKAREDLNSASLAESQRHNVATETETNRFNIANVGAKNVATYLQDRINQANVKIAQQRADTEASRAVQQNMESWAHIDLMNAQTGATEASRLRDLASATKDIVQADLMPANTMSQFMSSLGRAFSSTGKGGKQ